MFDFHKVCRACLSTENLNLLHTQGSAQACVSEMLMICTSVECHEDDGLPEHICTDCISELDRSYRFASKCLETDNKLRMYVQKIFTEAHCSNTPSVLKDPLAIPELQQELSQEMVVVKNEIDIDIKTEPVDTPIEIIKLEPSTNLIENIKIEDIGDTEYLDESQINFPALLEPQQAQDSMMNYEETPVEKRLRLGRERYRRWRARKSQEALDELRAKNAYQKAISRANATDLEAALRRAADAETKRVARAKETLEEAAARRAMNAENKRIARAKETLEEAVARRALNAEIKRAARAKESQDRADIRRAINAERQRIRRANQIQEEANAIRIINAERQRVRRTLEMQAAENFHRNIKAEIQHDTITNQTEQMSEIDQTKHMIEINHTEHMTEHIIFNNN